MKQRLGGIVQLGKIRERQRGSVGSIISAIARLFSWQGLLGCCMHELGMPSSVLFLPNAKIEFRIFIRHLVGGKPIVHSPQSDHREAAWSLTLLRLEPSHVSCSSQCWVKVKYPVDDFHPQPASNLPNVRALADPRNLHRDHTSLTM